MIIDLQIRRENLEAHIDIDNEMQRHKNKWYHFELRYSSGKIVDFVIREFVVYGQNK